MPKFRYRALSSMGKVVTGTMDDESAQKVKERLKNNGFKPLSVEKSRFLSTFSTKKVKKNKTTSSAVTKYTRDKLIEEQRKRQQKGLQKEITFDLSFLKKIKQRDIYTFTQSLYLLKRANFTNVRAFTTLLENTEHPRMRDIIEDILNGVESGEYIYSTLEYYNDIFPDIYVATIKVGELSGSLTNALFQAMNYLDSSEKTKKEVKKALVGPLLSAGGMFLGTVIGVLVGVPILENLYTGMGLEDQIPAATMAASRLIKGAISKWYITVAVVIAAIVAFKTWKSSIRGQYQWDMFKIKMPVFGGLILRLQLQKFFMAMQLNLANNAKLVDAIDISKDTVKNYVLLSVAESAQENLQQGESWIEPFERLPNIPNMVLEMLRIGMETDINEMVDKIVEFISDDITITIEKTVKILPQISTLIMGVFLIIFVLIVLTPIMQVYMGSFLFDAYL